MHRRIGKLVLVAQPINLVPYQSFQRTLELDPSDKQARSSIEKATKQRGKHVFKRKPTAGEKDAKRRRAEEPSKGKNSNKVKLSFADEDEDEGE